MTARWVGLTLCMALTACSSSDDATAARGGQLQTSHLVGAFDCPSGTSCLRRGAQLGWLVSQGSSLCAGADVQLRGTWQVGATVVNWMDAPRRLPVGATSRRPYLSSTAYFHDGWDAIVDQAWKGAGFNAQFNGEISLAVAATSGCALQWQQLTLVLQPTIQHIEIRSGTAFDAAVDRFGLGLRGQAILSRVQKLTRQAFEGFSVDVRLAADAQWTDVAERLVIELGDKDPNGLGLLGVDSSPGKDDGNLQLDEELAGVNRRARSLGRLAGGGVFVGELFAFSRKLHPQSAIADLGFDALFGPFAPVLGGDPAVAGDDTSAAVQALSALIADTLVHECGHALGLAAGTVGYHHAGDHLGWRMDEGKHRPFAERAAISGQVKWGAQDAAYLANILPTQ